MVNEYESNRKPIISSVFSMFNDSGNAQELSDDINDIINYEFVDGEDNEKHFEDCLNILKKSGLDIKIDELMVKFTKSKDSEERTKIMAEIDKLVKEKNNRG